MDYKMIFTLKGLTTINKFFTYLQNQFMYGWVDQKGNGHSGSNDAESYSLQSPEELLKSRLGICWDMVELYRCFFENMTSLKYETYYLFYEDNKGCPSHSILVFYDNNKVYWFEPMFNDKNCFYSGIHEYESIDKLLNDFIRVFCEFALFYEFIPANYNPANFNLYKYTAPQQHINGIEMRNHINNSEFINIEVKKKM